MGGGSGRGESKGRKRRRDRGRKRELMCERRRDKFICQLCCPSCSSVVDYYTSCVRTEPFSIMAAAILAHLLTERLSRQVSDMNTDEWSS